MDTKTSMKRLTEGGTYTFAQLQMLVGRELTNRVRALAGVPLLPVANPPRVRAPRKAAASKVPARAVRGSGRVGDRLART